MSYRDNYKLIDFSNELPVIVKPRHEMKRSSLAFPMVLSDTIDAVEHVDGRFYTSKSEFRKVTKANGLVEVGNDRSRTTPKAKPKPNRQEIRDSIKRAFGRI